MFQILICVVSVSGVSSSKREREIGSKSHRVLDFNESPQFCSTYPPPVSIVASAEMQHTLSSSSRISH